MPHEQFMELALYDEDEGYYSRNMHEIGLRGDFSTSATMSDLLAKRVANHWREACREYGRNLPIIEVGGGNASLALSIRRVLSLWERLRMRYYIVERSSSLRELQMLACGNFLRVYPEMSRALRRAGGHAFIFCNELVDAFPVRRFIYSNDSWQELGWTVAEGGRVIQMPRSCPQLPPSTAFAHWSGEGQIIEVHESYRKWYLSWQPLWRSGVFVTIDYGNEVDDLYYRRPLGTLRGYKAHVMLEAEDLPPLAGKCDITADVNFSDLRELAERNSGDAVQMITQREYLLPCADVQDAAQSHLLRVPGAGDHFHVLIQHRFEFA